MLALVEREQVNALRTGPRRGLFDECLSDPSPSGFRSYNHEAEKRLDLSVGEHLSESEHLSVFDRNDGDDARFSERATGPGRVHWERQPTFRLAET